MKSLLNIFRKGKKSQEYDEKPKGKKKYQCNECLYSWESEEVFTRCPHCYGGNIRIVD